MDDHPQLTDEEKSFFERESTMRLVWIALGVGCAGFAIAGFVLAGMGLMHPKFTISEFPAFYAAVGFFSFSFIVLVGQHLRKIIMRDEDYYDPDGGVK